MVCHKLTKTKLEITCKFVFLHNSNPFQHAKFAEKCGYSAADVPKHVTITSTCRGMDFIYAYSALL